MIRCVVIEDRTYHLQVDVADYDGDPMISVASSLRTTPRKTIDRQVFSIKRLSDDDAHWASFVEHVGEIVPNCVGEVADVVAAICGFRITTEDLSDGERARRQPERPSDEAPQARDGDHDDQTAR